jgi:hypothetical protein
MRYEILPGLKNVIWDIARPPKLDLYLARNLHAAETTLKLSVGLSFAVEKFYLACNMRSQKCSDNFQW